MSEKKPKKKEERTKSVENRLLQLAMDTQSKTIAKPEAAVAEQKGRKSRSPGRGGGRQQDASVISKGKDLRHTASPSAMGSSKHKRTVTVEESSRKDQSESKSRDLKIEQSASPSAGAARGRDVKVDRTASSTSVKDVKLERVPSPLRSKEKSRSVKDHDSTKDATAAVRIPPEKSKDSLPPATTVKLQEPRGRVAVEGPSGAKKPSAETAKKLKKKTTRESSTSSESSSSSSGSSGSGSSSGSSSSGSTSGSSSSSSAPSSPESKQKVRKSRSEKQPARRASGGKAKDHSVAAKDSQDTREQKKEKTKVKEEISKDHAGGDRGHEKAKAKHDAASQMQDDPDQKKRDPSTSKNRTKESDRDRDKTRKYEQEAVATESRKSNRPSPDHDRPARDGAERARVGDSPRQRLKEEQDTTRKGGTSPAGGGMTRDYDRGGKRTSPLRRGQSPAESLRSHHSAKPSVQPSSSPGRERDRQRYLQQYRDEYYKERPSEKDDRSANREERYAAAAERYAAERYAERYPERGEPAPRGVAAIAPEFTGYELHGEHYDRPRGGEQRPVESVVPARGEPRDLRYPRGDQRYEADRYGTPTDRYPVSGKVFFLYHNRFNRTF